MLKAARRSDFISRGQSFETAVVFLEEKLCLLPPPTPPTQTLKNLLTSKHPTLPGSQAPIIPNESLKWEKWRPLMKIDVWLYPNGQTGLYKDPGL